MSTKDQPKTTTEFACTDSPTGAHHWVLGSPGHVVDAVCKHCGSSREYRPYEAEEAGGYNRWAGPGKKAAADSKAS
ncbi:MAG: hypothetical protein V3S98_02120 [Dehalococcoidia bacterium]